MRLLVGRPSLAAVLMGRRMGMAGTEARPTGSFSEKLSIGTQLGMRPLKGDTQFPPYKNCPLIAKRSEVR